MADIVEEKNSELVARDQRSHTLMINRDAYSVGIWVGCDYDVPVYSKAGVDRCFAPKASVDALTNAQVAQGAEIGTLKEQVRAQAVLSNMLPRQGGPGTPAALVVGFIGDSWMTPGAGGPGKALFNWSN